MSATAKHRDSEKCPKCGAASADILEENGWVVTEFACGSSFDNDRNEIQSDKCRIAELTRQVERLRGMLKESFRPVGEPFWGDTPIRRWTDAEIDAELNKP